MTREESYQKLKEIVAKAKNYHPDEIKAWQKFVDDLGFGAAALAQLAQIINTEFAKEGIALNITVDAIRKASEVSMLEILIWKKINE